MDIFSGVHRIQEVSGKKRHTSIVSVCIVENQSASSKVIAESDITFKPYRGSGAGGQHRNKVATAMSGIHIPTGYVATSEDSKSQLVNRQRVVEKLQAIIDAEKQSLVVSAQNNSRNSQIGNGERPEASWNWNGWRDSVSIPGYGNYNMSKVLKGRFPF